MSPYPSVLLITATYCTSTTAGCAVVRRHEQGQKRQKGKTQKSRVQTDISTTTPQLAYTFATVAQPVLCLKRIPFPSSARLQGCSHVCKPDQAHSFGASCGLAAWQSVSMLPSRLCCCVVPLPMLPPHVPWRMAFLTGETRASPASPASQPATIQFVFPLTPRRRALSNPAAFQPCQRPPHHTTPPASLHASIPQYVCVCAPPRHPHQSQPPQQQLSTVEYYWSRAARRTKASTRCWMRGTRPCNSRAVL